MSEVGSGALRIDARGAFQHEAALAMLAAHAVPGAEEVTGSTLRRVMTVEGSAAIVTVVLDAGGATVTADVALDDPDALASRIRHWLDLERDAAIADGALAADPVIGSLVAKRPGLRLIGSTDEFAAVAGTVIGQQVSLAAARTFAGRLVAAYGAPVGDLRAFPDAGTVAGLELDELRRSVGLTNARARTLQEVARRWAAGPLLRGLPTAEARRLLLDIPGVGPWTADYVQVRVLQDPDTFAPGDLVARRALGMDQREAAERAEAWAPYRSYALLHLWTDSAYL